MISLDEHPVAQDQSHGIKTTGTPGRASDMRVEDNPLEPDTVEVDWDPTATTEEQRQRTQRVMDHYGVRDYVTALKKIPNARGDPRKIKRRPQQRSLTTETQSVINEWFDTVDIKIGDAADIPEKQALEVFLHD
ncbi:hypothetical protein ACKVWC_009901 [Pyricularia oryzae]